MEYLQYQLHVSASTLANVRFVVNFNFKLNTNLTMANVEAETCS